MHCCIYDIEGADDVSSCFRFVLLFSLVSFQEYLWLLFFFIVPVSFLIGLFLWFNFVNRYADIHLLSTIHLHLLWFFWFTVCDHIICISLRRRIRTATGCTDDAG